MNRLIISLYLMLIFVLIKYGSSKPIVKEVLIRDETELNNANSKTNNNNLEDFILDRYLANRADFLKGLKLLRILDSFKQSPQIDSAENEKLMIEDDGNELKSKIGVHFNQKRRTFFVGK
ncbi:unnamed protein product [Brachionus calyciflorus]|uniref:Uncharacterized protein n=1 Tax=Brachionus calyciflorus TaxID=104777 RepID=A0A813MVW8_9BILA|nr:unnamed protein product [Brachionus calyciflorus]